MEPSERSAVIGAQAENKSHNAPDGDALLAGSAEASPTVS
jgi:hypothetical protein